MRIGIIGCGRIGGTLARHFSAADHEVAVSNSRDPASLAPLAEALPGVHPATPAEAARFGQVVVVSIPFGRYRELSSAELAGKTVIDTTNYLPERDGHYLDLDAGRVTSSELIQRHLPAAHVVKAFNTMRWDHLRDYGHEAGALERYGIPVSGDDDGAKWTVLDLIEQIGFQPVDVGDLAHGGRRHQPGTPVFLADLTAGELRDRLAEPVG